ncbi:sodium:solute symporter family protein [Halothermothrix orenii]|uniref:Sodium:solute symporter n=1 Tax=Halothermothrix orenii (strain H 168 / OCM 544 / DSM 9562) TaxID=373903 RepID=B8D272_HALOH|nr:sodium:solute symporter family protein [Halothermothrix orenii]ACL69299.1 Sodium:solute symporter [Halothermothrix orenii H 168]
MEWYYLIPLVYLFLLLVVGFVIAKRQETRSDFYVASNKMDGSVLFATVMSTVVGANTYMGFSGLIYNGGLHFMWMLSGAGLAYFILFFISGKIRKIATKYEVFTLPDLVELRYSNPVALLTTFFSLIGLVGGIGGGLLGLGVILNSLLGIPTTTAIIVTSIITIIYTCLGGLWGVSLTDWIQSIIMIAGVAVCIVFGITSVTPGQSFVNGAFEIVNVLKQQLGTELVSPFAGLTFFMALAWTITFMPLNTISQTQIQRVYAAKNVKTIRGVSLLMIIFVAMVLTFGLAFIGILGRVALPGLKNAEAVFPQMSMKVINPALGILIVTGIMGAAMSTVDSNLLGSAMHVTRDLYERYMRYKNKSVDEKRILFISRVTIVIIGVISTIAALFTPSIMSLLLITMKIFAGATFAPVLIGLYWKRANAFGALLGEILGGMAVVINIIHPVVNLDPVIFGIIMAVLGTITGSLFTKENTEKGSIFSFANDISSKGWLAVIAIALLYFGWVISMNNYAMWPYFIITTVVLLVLSVVFLIYSFITERTGN